MPLPFVILAAFFSSSDAGGVLRMKVKLRSSNTEISTGMIVPTLSDVRALYSLQNIMMFTPAAPSAGPTGGAGLALPASSASLIILDTFLAIITGSGCRCGLVALTDRTALRVASALAPAIKAGVGAAQENSTAHARTARLHMLAIGEQRRSLL